MACRCSRGRLHAPCANSLACRPCSELRAPSMRQRGAHEMVKSISCARTSAAAGVPLLAAVSAPTSLAITTAQAARLALIGFARGDDLVTYTHPERLALETWSANRVCKSTT